MKVPKEIEEKIRTIFKYNEELKNQLLNGDESAIQQLAIISGMGFDSKDIVESFDCGTEQYLYKKAKEMLQIRELYRDLCQWHVLRSAEKAKDKTMIKRRV